MRSLLICGLAAIAYLIAGPFFRTDGVSAGTAVRLDVQDLAYNSALIVEGRVLTSRTVDIEGLVATEYLVEIERTFEGSDQTYRSICLPGGVRADGSGMLLAGMPMVFEGDTSLFFLTSESSNGMRMPVGLSQGKFDVVRMADGTKQLVRDASEVTLVNPVTGTPAGPVGRAIYDYAEVVADIERGLAKKRGR